MASLKRKRHEEQKEQKERKIQGPRLIVPNSTQNLVLFVKYMEHYGAVLMKSPSFSLSFASASEEYRMILECLQQTQDQQLKLAMPIPGMPFEYLPKQDWLHTYKCDGVRCILMLYQDVIYVVSGRGTKQEVKHQNLIYPHVPARNEGAYLIVDGEMVQVNEGDQDHKRYIFVACDLLAVEGYSCIKMPAEERLKIMFMFLYTLNQKFVPNTHQSLMQVVPKRYFAHNQLPQLETLMTLMQPDSEKDRLLFEDYPIYTCVEPISKQTIKVDGIVSVQRNSPYFCKRHHLLKSKSVHTNDFAVADLIGAQAGGIPVLSPFAPPEVRTQPWTFFLECGLPTAQAYHTHITPATGPVILPVGWAVMDPADPIEDTTLPPASSPNSLWSLTDTLPVEIALDLMTGKWIMTRSSSSSSSSSSQSIVSIDAWFKECLEEYHRLQTLARGEKMAYRKWIRTRTPRTKSWTFAVRKSDVLLPDTKVKAKTKPILFGYQHTNPYQWKSQASRRLPLERDTSTYQKRHIFHPRGAREKYEQTQQLSDYAGTLQASYPSSARCIVSMGTLPYDGTETDTVHRDSIQLLLSEHKTPVIYECGLNARTMNWDLLLHRTDKLHPNFHVTVFDDMRCMCTDWSPRSVLEEGR